MRARFLLFSFLTAALLGACSSGGSSYSSDSSYSSGSNYPSSDASTQRQGARADVTFLGKNVQFTHLVPGTTDTVGFYCGKVTYDYGAHSKIEVPGIDKPFTDVENSSIMGEVESCS